jgi:hypothetical protein
MNPFVSFLPRQANDSRPESPRLAQSPFFVWKIARVEGIRYKLGSAQAGNPGVALTYAKSSWLDLLHCGRSNDYTLVATHD